MPNKLEPPSKIQGAEEELKGKLAGSRHLCAGILQPLPTSVQSCAPSSETSRTTWLSSSLVSKLLLPLPLTLRSEVVDPGRHA
jgi:hypothetical protein